MGLFKSGSFVSHSGYTLPFKIECDALTDEDLYCLAQLISSQVDFRAVYSVPTGGDRFGKVLSNFRTPSENVLLVDDVLTTGESMEKCKGYLKGDYNILGWVIFARGELPDWINAVFKYEK